MEDRFTIWLTEKEFQTGFVFKAILLQVQYGWKDFSITSQINVWKGSVWSEGCDVCHLYSAVEVVHKSEGRVHGEASGAGDVRL